MPCSRLVGPSGLLLALLPLTASAVSYSYSLQDTYAGSNFYEGFNFFTDSDPTHGFVQYVDQATAISSGILGYGTGNTAKWGVDDTTVLYANSTGRQSVRLEGKVNYNHGLFLADIKHMPGSICGVWPAFWTLGDSTWPAHGELDIIEGVNMASTNQIAAHTAPNCTMKFQNQTGWANGYDCAVSTGGAAGCATGSNDQTGYGDGFNANGGGVYAMQWTSEFMKVWFFPRNAIPASISSGSPSPALDFGTPVGNFDGGSCDIDSHFINHRMIFDTTFCGDWAGSVYSSTSCPLASSGGNGCVDYVAGNPSAFKEAYWEVNYIKFFDELDKHFIVSVGILDKFHSLIVFVDFIEQQHSVLGDFYFLVEQHSLNFDIVLKQQHSLDFDFFLQQQQQHPLYFFILIINQNLNQQHQQQAHRQLIKQQIHHQLVNHKAHFDIFNPQIHNLLVIHKVVHKFQAYKLEQVFQHHFVIVKKDIFVFFDVVDAQI
ncbi:glycoside hydrolase family 16 protein, partial [Aureobasidium melanogenum]